MGVRRVRIVAKPILFIAEAAKVLAWKIHGRAVVDEKAATGCPGVRSPG